MKNKIGGLRTCIYKVSDLNAATAWYTRAFGVAPYFNEPFYVGFNIAGYELGLQPDETHAAQKADNVVAYWGVNDLDEEYKHFIEAGAMTHEAPQEAGGDIRVATVKDPWGNVIGLIYNPHFKIS
jgi:predicted enzyme related to lactoylglutathione lyase